jgi:serine/threonine protein kinase
VLAGRYRLVRMLGRGGMATVRLARDDMLGREVAVTEVIPPVDLPADERRRVRQRALREARAAARISNPFAVTVYDVIDEDHRPWIVMQRLDAASLADVLTEDGPIPPHRAAQIGLCVLDALSAAHDAGVLHRDVKPANVMLTEFGRAVLTDSGSRRSREIRP